VNKPTKHPASALPLRDVWHHRRTALLGFAVLFAGSLLLSAAISGGAQDTGGISGFAPARVAAERQLEEKFRAIPDPAHAESSLRHLTSEPHMAGTEASHRVAEWLRDQYRSFGFDAEIVTYSAWLPQAREVTLELTKPENKKLASPEQPVDVDKDTFDKRIVPAFNIYSPSGEATASVVYVNYGTQEDYRTLESTGVHVEGKIVLARYGKGYRGVKAKLAEEHKAAALIIYSDPKDDGNVAGETFPNGPWRPMSGIQRGSINYIQSYPGDPLTPGVGATPDAKRIAPADAASLPRIPTMPINAQDAAVILVNLGGEAVPSAWQGGLPFTYHVGPGGAEVHMKLVMDYQQRPIYDVIAKLRGTSDDEWVVLGNHHDAWVYGAADPGSGTATLLETGRALGELAKSGWKPRRTIVICAWDGEEPGLIGSTEWVEANRAELQNKAVAYLNTDVAVNGPNFGASATPSLKALLRDATREVEDPRSGHSVYDTWREHAAMAKGEVAGTARQEPDADSSGEAPISALGSGSDYSAFLEHAGIPSMDMGFTGDYGVYHSVYDDFYWMKHFGDPNFVYHAALARIIGTVALRLDEADILPYDFPAYALEIEHMTADRVRRAARDGNEQPLQPALDAADKLSNSAARASQALRAISGMSLDPAKASQINRAIAAVEQGFLAPDGLVGRPWYQHVLYAPGSYTGYASVLEPGVTEALDRGDSATLRHEVDSLAAALTQVSARLDEITRLAQQATPPAPAAH
jgi:N-acetylated-alpha-linked acidic dipeptidase